ncbi:hypothetical protein OHW52_14015 [Acinetobacter baumannii]|nr:hypothetical protein [Acinetobacter baumannii]
MTFIVAIQLNDSIIVACDNKKATSQIDNTIHICNEKICKIYLYNKGLLTGAGEYQVINRSAYLFKSLRNPSLEDLSNCLVITKLMRESEVGKGFYQIENSKLLYSTYTNDDTQLYIIEPSELINKNNIMALKPMDIIVWLYQPDITLISTDLQILYDNLMDYSHFLNKTEWVNYYIKWLAPIFKTQNKIDPLMSQSFDIFLQSKDEYVLNHVANT